MHFHAPREILEHPALLLDALCASAVPVSLDNTGFRASGSVGESDIRMLFGVKRFRSSLPPRPRSNSPAIEIVANALATTNAR
jgi:hypothetical protein